MDQYCVVLCGLRAGAPDETSAWQPVAAALKLDHAEFERRIVAALPRIVRRELDLATAQRIAQVLQALQVDARVLPDDPQLVYVERAGASRGPLPQSSLEEFIQPGESFRRRGSATWQPWPEPRDEVSPTTAEVDAIDEPSSSPASGGELTDAITTPDTSHDHSDAASEQPPTVADEPPELALKPPLSAASDHVGDAPSDAMPSDTGDQLHEALGAAPTARELTPAPPEAWEATGATTHVPELACHDDFIPDDLISNGAIDAIPSGANNDEPDGAMPPPLGTPPSAPQEPMPASPEDGAAIERSTDFTKPVRDEDLLDPAADTTASASPDDAALSSSEAVETRPPARSNRGRFIVLLVFIALAIWAYRHWKADTRTDRPSAAPTVTHPANFAEGKSATPVSTMPADNSASATAPAGAATPATSTAAPAGTAALPAAAMSTPAPAASGPTPAPATSSGTVTTKRAR